MDDLEIFFWGKKKLEPFLTETQIIGELDQVFARVEKLFGHIIAIEILPQTPNYAVEEISMSLVIFDHVIKLIDKTNS